MIVFSRLKFLKRFLGSKTKPVRPRIVTFVTLVETRKFIFSRPVSAVFSISHLFPFYENEKIAGGGGRKQLLLKPRPSQFLTDPKSC